MRLGARHLSEHGAIVLVSGYPARKCTPGAAAISTVGNAVEGFVRAVAGIAAPALGSFVPDHVLMSYHGLPERQIRALDPTRSHCLESAGCCDAIGSANARCYRAHCVATTRALQKALDLDPERSSFAFQSRLGRTPWIRPFTDVRVEELAAAGTRRLAVFVPSFVADCLETLEEIGMRARESFREAGGEDLRLVPSLNAHASWARAAATLVTDAAACARPRGRVGGAAGGDTSDP